MRRSRRVSEDEFGKVEMEVFGQEMELEPEPEEESKPSVPVKGIKRIPKFKNWAEREKFYMKQK